MPAGVDVTQRVTEYQKYIIMERVSGSESPAVGIGGSPVLSASSALGGLQAATNWANSGLVYYSGSTEATSRMWIGMSSGTVAQAVATYAGSTTLGDARKRFYLYDEGGEYLESDGTDLVVASGNDITLDATADIILDAAGGNIEFHDAGTVQLSLDMDGTGGAQIFKLGVNSDRLVFQQYDGTEVLGIEDDASLKIAGGLGSSGVTVTSAGALSADGRIVTDDTTAATSTTDGSLQTDGGLSVALDAVVGDDLILLSDSAVIHFGAGQDVTLTHTNDVGLHLNAGMRLGFRDQGGEYITSAADGHLEVNAATTLDMTAPTVDVNASTAVTLDTPSVQVASSDASAPIVHITNTHAGATSGELRFNKDSASGADSDIMGMISFYGTDDSDNTHERLAYMDAIITDSAHGSEAASLRFYVAENDATLTQGLLIAGQADDNGEVDVTIGAGVGSTCTIAGDLTVNGTTTTVNQTIIESTVSVLVFEGASADAHETTLKVVEPTADCSFSLPTLTAGSFFIPALADTATDASSAVTAAEFALLDGGSTVGTTAVADGDGIVTNDGGAMKHTTVQTFQTYFDANSVGGGNIVTVGALNAGSITSGFGNIDNGSSTLDTGVGTLASLVCTAGATFGGGTGDTGATITTGGAITADGIIKTESTQAATSTTDGSIQTDGGLSVALDAVVGDDLILLSDAAVIHFGANKDVTMTHVADVGLTITHIGTGDNLPVVLQLKSEEDAVIANEVIASMEFAAGDSDGTDGATVAAGIHAIAEETFAADANATKLVFTTADSETAAASATAKMTLASTGNLTTAGSITAVGSFIIGSADMSEADLEKLDGITNGTAAASKALVVDSNLDIGTLRNLTINGTFSDGNYTFDTSGNVSGLGTVSCGAITATGTSTFATACSPDAEDGASLGTNGVGWSDLFLADGAQIAFGDDAEVTLTHQADSGLLLSDASGVGTTKLMFGDTACYVHQAADGQLDVVADTIIQVTAPLVNIEATSAITLESDSITFGENGNTDVALNFNASSNDGLLTWMEDEDHFLFADDVSLTYNEKFKLGSDSEYLMSNGAGQITLAGQSHIDLLPGSASTLRIGADGGGKDVIIYGGASNEKVEWDASENYLKFSSASGAPIGYIGGDSSGEFFVDVVEATTNSGKIRATSFVTYSDETLKTNIAPMDNAVETVMKLQGVNFDWKKSGRSDFGFIAQDLREVLPECVSGEDTDGVLGVDYSRLTAVLVEAMKSQQTEIDALKSAIAKLSK